VLVGGAPADVLIQCFERRCLTYTPDNAPEWQVESGNVGQHYYRWLYEQDGEAQGPCPDSSEGAYLYVADQFNDRVQKFNGAGDFICAWGGGEPPTGIWGGTLGEGYAGDNSIVVTTTGKSLAYVTDTFNEQVHVFSYSFGANGAEELNLIGDFGTAEGQFDNPVGIGVNGR
jgi:hypothetical protein